MNSWKEHLYLGLALSLPAVIIYIYLVGLGFHTIDFYLHLIPVIILSPIIMDVDHRVSYLREKLTLIFLICAVLGSVLYYYTGSGFQVVIISAVLGLLTFGLRYLTGHRGFTHSLSFSLLWGGIIYLITGYVVLGYFGVLGALSHLLGDKMFKLY